jgi:hypothetical protein
MIPMKSQDPTKYSHTIVETVHWKPMTSEEPTVKKYDYTHKDSHNICRLRVDRGTQRFKKWF